MKKAIFITGTGTDVGKTYVSALLVKALIETGRKTGWYKAALSGAERREHGLDPGDASYVKKVAALNQPLETMVSYIYEHAVSPHLAARWEGNPCEMDQIKKDFQRTLERHESVVVEGSGGIVCPLRFDQEKKILLEDVIKELGLDVLVVADAGLGTINASVLTVAYLKQRQIGIRGFILNRFHPEDEMEEDNRRMIEELTGIPVVAVVEENGCVLNMRQGDVDTLIMQLTK